MYRFTDRAVRSTFVTACRLATSPTSTSPFLAKATTDGVVLAPSALATTVGSPPSRTATTEFVVPRSIPTARPIAVPFRQGTSRTPAQNLSGLLSMPRPPKAARPGIRVPRNGGCRAPEGDAASGNVRLSGQLRRQGD